MQQPGPSAPQAVFGLQINDQRLAKLTRRVLAVAALSALLQIVTGLVNYGFGSAKGNGLSSVIISILISLLVPMCGYFGAKNSDANLTCCFCGCNFLSACCTIFSLVTSFVVVHGFQNFIDHCPGGETGGDCPSDEQWQSICQSFGAPDYGSGECYDYIKHNLGKAEAGLVFAGIIGAPSILLSCLGFCWGNKLYKEIKDGNVLVQPPPQFPMAATAVQPGVPLTANQA